MFGKLADEGLSPEEAPIDAAVANLSGTGSGRRSTRRLQHLANFMKRGRAIR